MYLQCEWCGKYFYRRHKPDSRYKGVYCSQDCITARDVNNYKLKFIRENKKYRIIHYENKNDVTVACRDCGSRKNTNSASAIRLKTCSNCIRLKNERKAEKKRALRDKKQQYNNYCKRLNNLMEQIEKNYNKKLAQEEREERRKEQRRAEQKRHEIKREKRMKNNGRMDKDISLKKLYKRDKGICYICGELCDYNDYNISENGAFIARKFYPSIDHVQPLSKGGLHTWDNIKLAHMICNSKKNARPI